MYAEISSVLMQPATPWLKDVIKSLEEQLSSTTVRLQISYVYYRNRTTMDIRNCFCLLVLINRFIITAQLSPLIE